MSTFQKSPTSPGVRAFHLVLVAIIVMVVTLLLLMGTGLIG